MRLSVRPIIWIGLVCLLAAALLSACDDGSSPAPTDLPTSTRAPSKIPTQSTSDTTIATPVPKVTPEPTATVLVLTPEPTLTQAPTATPTPEPSPVEIGTTVEAGGSSYTLNEVKDPAPAGVFGVAAGKRLVALDITQVGISDGGDPYNSLYFAVQDTDGYVHVPGFAEQADVGPSFGFGELAAGQIVRGWVVFELPESARLVSVLVEAEVFGAKVTITDLAQDRDGDIVSHTPIPFPTPSLMPTATPTQVPTPTPIPVEKALPTMQMNINDSKGNDIKTLEQWSASVSRAHWVEGRSAYALADFILNRNGAAYLESRISSVLSQPVKLEHGAPEYAAKFDRYGGPARLDIGISGQTASGESLFVGVEAKVDEPFGSETVCERYQEAVEYLKSNPRSKAAARVEELLLRYLADNDVPCESRFADVGYQLLTASAGTVASEADISVFYVMVFKTRLYNGGKGEENRLDYENFINLVGDECLMRDNEVCLAHYITLDGRRLICIYEYFDVEG